jgi:GT2 family glycosyltransferase
MNNDTVIDRGALTALVQTATIKERAGFVTGKVYFYDRPEILQTVGKFEHPILWSGGEIGWDEKDVGQYEFVSERIFADDVYMLVNRAVYDEIGGYDPEFFLQCEEWDWQLRAKKKGWRIYYTPSAKLWHRGSASTGGLGSPINRYLLNRNWIVVMAKHADRMQFVRYYVWEGCRLFIRFLKALVQLNWSKIKIRLANLLGFFAGTWWLVRRQPSTGVPSLIQRMTDV